LKKTESEDEALRSSRRGENSAVDELKKQPWTPAPPGREEAAVI